MIVCGVVRRYREHNAVIIGVQELRWHLAVVSLRAVVGVAARAHDGTISEHSGHPWPVVKCS